MAFKIKSEAEWAAEAAMTPREKDVRSEKEAFERIAHRIHSDDLMRKSASTEHRIITLGEHPSASFGGRVKDHDGNKRDAFTLSMPFREDGGVVNHDNVDQAIIAVYWASRADGEQHKEDGHDPRIRLGEMTAGSKVSLLGRTEVVPGRDGQKHSRFVATEAMQGVHSEEALRSRGPDHIAVVAERYMKASTREEKEAISSAYAESVVARDEAKASGRGIMSQADGVTVTAATMHVPPSLGLAKGPRSVDPVAAAASIQDHKGR